jgi:hypothetical protein
MRFFTARMLLPDVSTDATCILLTTCDPAKIDGRPTADATADVSPMLPQYYYYATTLLLVRRQDGCDAAKTDGRPTADATADASTDATRNTSTTATTTHLFSNTCDGADAALGW